jgi:hypothetical protein
MVGDHMGILCAVIFVFSFFFFFFSESKDLNTYLHTTVQACCPMREFTFAGGMLIHLSTCTKQISSRVWHHFCCAEAMLNCCRCYYGAFLFCLFLLSLTKGTYSLICPLVHRKFLQCPAPFIHPSIHPSTPSLFSLLIPPCSFAHCPFQRRKGTRPHSAAEMLI